MSTPKFILFATFTHDSLLKKSHDGDTSEQFNRIGIRMDDRVSYHACTDDMIVFSHP